MSAALVLVPTRQELDIIGPVLQPVIQQLNGHMALCGFGMAVAAARTAHLIATLKPSAVYLTGIAGAINPALQSGHAYRFSAVSCYGIGAGSGDSFQTAEQMGWCQWQPDNHSPPIGDTLTLSPRRQIGCSTGTDALQLLTVSAASASQTDVTQRLTHFPQAAAEDMEAFSVAVACRLADVPLAVVRGISNTAGDRNKQHWDIPAALNSAAELTRQLLQASSA